MGKVVSNSSIKPLIMKDVFLALAVMGIPSAATYLLINLVLSYRLKNKMIEKGYVQEENQAVFKTHFELNHLSPLKWGIIIFLGGLSLVLLEYIPFRYNSPFPFGFVAMFVASGFLIYFFIVKKENEKSENN